MRRHSKKLGSVVAGAGVVIILAMVLPPAAWWLALGIALVIIGIWMLRCGI